MTKNYLTGITLEALIQYIEGNANDKVRQSVDNWLQEDNNHTIFFDKIKRAWLDLDLVKDLNETNIDQDWNNILNRIDLAKRNKQEKRHYHEIWYRKPWIYAAAVFAVVISIAGGYFLGNSSKENNKSIVYNEILVPKGEKSQLVLSDGTSIWINAGSTLKFPNRFDGDIREVWLDGEAFFEVAKDKSRPFFVRTSDVNIKVLGTKFNVKAYGDENIIETTLVEGLVSLEQKSPADNRKNKNEIFLEPNHKAIYIKNELTLKTERIQKEISEPLQARKIIISNPVQVETVTAWKEGKLIFEDEVLENIAKMLERRYDVSISIEDSIIKQARYSGVLKNVSVEQAIKAIQLISNFDFIIKGNKIIIY